MTTTLSDVSRELANLGADVRQLENELESIRRQRGMAGHAVFMEPPKAVLQSMAMNIGRRALVLIESLSETATDETDRVK